MDESAFTQQLTEAIRLHEAGDVAAAAHRYQALAAARPDAASPVHFLGIALHQLGRPEEGLERLRESVGREPARADWWNTLGNVLTARHLYDEAAEAFAHALALDPDQDALVANLGSVYQRLKRHPEAEAAYLRALALNPRNAEALRLLAGLAGEQGRKMESARYHARAVIVEAGAPGGGMPPQLYELGKAHLVLGEVGKAAEVYRRWLDAEPGNATARHLYAACSGLGVPDQCSPAYIEETFDAFAATFEEKLLSLAYRGPELIAEALRRAAPPEGRLDVLDACCGTGLCGPLLQPYAATLTGVDLSQGMLAQAEERKVYGTLVKSDLGAYLRDRPGGADLIVCADALIYFGDLAPLLAAVARGLRPGGLFLATIETEAGPEPETGYRLNPTGRYCHSQGYLRRALEACGLELRELVDAELRTELDRPVPACVLTAARPLVDG